jgi:hypothetical protein
MALAHGFEETDTGGDGDVQTLDGAGHGDSGEEVAIFAGEAAGAFFFGAHDDAEGALEVDIVEELLGFIGGADEPEAGVLKFFHGAGEVGDLDEGGMFGGPAGDAADGFGEGNGFILGSDDGMDSGGVGGAETSSQVMRVLDAVEDEDEGAIDGRERFEEFVFADARDGGAEVGVFVRAVAGGGGPGLGFVPGFLVIAARWAWGHGVWEGG